MKKTITILMLIVMSLSVLFAVEYKTYEAYKEMPKAEREAYLQDLSSDLENNMQRKSDANAQKEKLDKEIAELETQLNNTDNEYNQVYDEILADLKINKNSLKFVEQKINYFNNKIENWEQLSDEELWNAKKSIAMFVEEYEAYKNTNEAKAPDFRKSFSDLDRKVLALNRNLKAAEPKYYEDEYTVVKGDYLSKIAGYKQIYNDPTKWGIIYRANRDQVTDPNVLNVDSILKIPRGLPKSWKVWRGECLWKIAAYPEVYGSGSKWPLIYRANKDKIKDPNLIYPKREFVIPRD